MNPFVRLLHEILQFRARLTVAVVSVIGLALSQLYLTWLVKRWVEGPLATGDTAALRALMSVAVVVTIIATIFLFLSRYTITDLNQRVIEDLRNRAVRRVFDAEVMAVRRYPSGDLLSRLFTDAGVLSNFVSVVLRRSLRESIVAAGAIVMMFVLHWQLALATFTLVPLTALLLARIGKTIRRWGHVAQRDIGALSATFNEQIHGFATIKGYQAEDFEASRFAAQNRAFREKVMRAELWSALLMCAVFLITGAGLLAIVWFGGELATGAMTHATLLAFALYAAQTVEPLRRLSEIHGQLQLSLASATRVYEVIDTTSPGDVGGAPHAKPRQPRAIAIRFDHVAFAYRDDAPVLSDFTLTVNAGERWGLAGASGSGKSTLAALLLRFLTPHAGRILVDGIDHSQLPLDELRRRICVVEQEPFLFSGPLLDNIRYGSWTASRASIERAAEMAGLGDVLARLPSGLDTLLHEAGRDLSGGEKQRVALARAIVRDPDLLVLDEATSAIDSDIERAIFDAMDPWLAQRTVIATAHRLSTLTRFQRVALLEGGRVIASGSVSTLASSCDAFRLLFHDQLLARREADTTRLSSPSYTLDVNPQIPVQKPIHEEVS